MLSLQTLEFCPYFYKLWNYGLISPNIGILTSSFETLQLWPYLFLNIGILALFWYALVSWSYPLKPWDSSPISISIGILILSFETQEVWTHSYKQLNQSTDTSEVLYAVKNTWKRNRCYYFCVVLALQSLEFWPYLYTRRNSCVILSQTAILAL